MSNKLLVRLGSSEMEMLEMSDDTCDNANDRETNPSAAENGLLGVKLDDISLRASSTQVDCEVENEDEATKTSLVYTKHMRIEVKDVYNEVRSLKEVERFLESPTILLNIHETRLDDIIEKTLKKLISNNEGIVVDEEEARNAFFTKKDSVHHLSHVIQGTEKAEGSGWEEAQNWLIAMAELPWLNRSYVAMSTLSHATNLGRTLQEAHLVVLILAPRKTKKTKSSLETGRTFATILSDIETRQQLIASENETEFLNVLSECKKAMASGEYQQKIKKSAMKTSSFIQTPEEPEEKSQFSFGRGITDDVRRRWPHYPSDFIDGIRGHRTPYKLASTVFFLYFACLLPSIAFGVLNSKNTQGKIGVKQVIIAQSISGILYSLLSGQPLIVLLTTAPLALYVKVMHDICEDMDLDFHAMYTMTGLWNTFFLVLYSVFGASYVMRWSTRSINEIFALFISVAFAVASFESIYEEYSKPSCRVIPLYNNITNVTNSCHGVNTDECFCSREGGTLYILLSCGCVLLGVTLYSCKKSPLLDANKREALADYALPVSVILFSFIGSFIFKDITMNTENYDVAVHLSVPSLSSLSVGAVLGSCGLGFSLSLLFFVEQNIGSAIVNSPSNRLKKGTAYHLDLLVIGVLNGILSLFGLPWVHAALPHSPLHVRALADVEERVDQGHVFDIIVKVRETRLSILISHVLIGLSIMMIPSPLGYIPNAVLDGLFLFVAITPLYNNQMFERSMLLVTEQSAYPPNHYIRRVPQRKIHQYTGLQLLQLAIVCGFGFLGSSYTKMFFPVLLILLVPVRHILVPKLIDHKFLDAMDANL